MKLVLALSALVATVAANGHGSTLETFKVPALYPEGIAYDAVNNRLIIGSYISTSLVTVNASDPTQLLTSYERSDYDPIRNCFGLKSVDGGQSVMCAQTTTMVQDQGALVRYDISYNATSAEGTAMATDTFPYPCKNVTEGTGCGLANDMVIVDENMYATDSANGRILKLGDGTTEVLSEDALLSSSNGFGANGIAYDDRSGGDNGVLIVSNIGDSSLVTVDVTTGEVATVEIDGAGDDGKFESPDGLLLLPDGRLVVISVSAAHVLSQVDDGAWSKVKIDETVSFADQVKANETAASVSLGPKDEEVFVSFVRLAEVPWGTPGNITMAGPATIGKITIAPGDHGGDGEGGATPATPSAPEPEPESEPPTSSGATFVLGSITAAVAIALGVFVVA